MSTVKSTTTGIVNIDDEISDVYDDKSTNYKPNNDSSRVSGVSRNTSLSLDFWHMRENVFSNI